VVYGVVCGVWWGTVNGVVYGEVGVGVVCMWCGVCGWARCVMVVYGGVVCYMVVCRGVVWWFR
jgi:hypothetical protein